MPQTEAIKVRTEYPEFYVVDPETRALTINVHRGQQEVLSAAERFILVLAGTQSGKTLSGPPWLYFEIGNKGPGTYLAVAPTFALMEKKMIPEFRKLFEEILQLGKYYASPSRKFVFSPEGLKKTFGSSRQKCEVLFGYAEDPESLESMTIKACWADECGQRKFKLESFEALVRRLSIHQGRMLMTTTPYEINWLKTKIHDRAHNLAENEDKDPDIRVINFRSVDNPTFPLKEYERARATMAEWKFAMMYEGQWRRPAGAILDCFDPKVNVCEPFQIPASWEIRVLGVDFGQTNTAAAFLALHPNGRDIYLYRTYHTGGKSATEHVESLLLKEPTVPFGTGGAPSEDDWRAEFTAAGLPIARPLIGDVEKGIDLLYEALKTGRLKIFSTLTRIIDEIQTYSRKLDENGEPIPGTIEDKHRYHRVDALRYGIIEIMRGPITGPQVINSLPSRSSETKFPRVFRR